MYKVFVNDKLLIITSSLKNETIFPVYNFININFDTVFHLLNINDKGIILYSTDLQSDWKTFTNHLKVIPAAGGLVLNDAKDYLFIYRNGIWDLPKGRIETDETIETAAIREVEEECGIFNLQLIKPLVTTYHIYHQKGIKLKETHWFLMFSNYNKVLKPQLEEGITEVVFKNELETAKALENSYENIKLVINAYKNK